MLALVLAVALQAAATPAALADVPHHKLVFENEKVRVFRVELAAGQAVPRHDHEHDFLRLALNNVTLEIAPEKGKREIVRLARGRMDIITAGSSESVNNAGRTTADYLVIEVLPGVRPREASCGLGQGDCEGEVGGDLRKGGYAINTFFTTPTTRAGEASIDPGVTTDQHQHTAPHLLVALTPAHLRNSVAGQDDAELQWQAGDVLWVAPGPPHSLTNLGDQRVKFITVEVR